LMVKILTQLFQ